MKVLSNFGPLVVAIILLTTAVWWPGVRVPPPLRIAVGLGPSTHSFLAASYNHRLDDLNLRVIEMPWPSAAIRAMQNDVVDGTILSLSEAVRMHADGYKIIIAGTLGISSGADAVMSLKVRSMEELRGKRIGIESRSAANHVLAMGFHKVGLKLSDVELVEMSLPETVDALLNGEVDAVATSEPFRTLIELSQGHCLFDSNELGNDIVRVLVASERSANEQREQWARVATERDASLLELNPALLEALARREKLTPASLVATRQHQTPILITGSNRMTEEKLTMLLKRTAASMVETGQIDPISELPKVHLLNQLEAAR